MTRVAVAMSGGVDSSVTAALMKNKYGGNIFGIFMKTHEYSDATDAINVAEQLDIELHVIDYSESFDNTIIKYYINSYNNGETPNPCVMCNEKIKFGKLWEYAQLLGANAMATGHYAIAKDGGIFRSVCEEKDQSYFMYRLNPNDVRLGKFLFPLGEFDKNWVRKTARCMGLCVCEKKESQDICFVKGNYLNYTGYGCSGNILNTSGKKIGEHNGICQFTIGKRKGFGSFGKEPMYVVDFNNNDIIVGTKNNLFNKNKLFLTDVVWHKIPLSGSNLIVQQLYHGRKMNAKIMLESQNVEIVFTDCLTYSPYGQSLVIYDGDRVIGGGIITKDPY